ncbi:MAG TPA: dienelactone hydrolase family protein [Alphaproteobacteria bacterium]|nr:dienelactone hydrolase family protein [Alphaproteobacteria bacterium]
MLHPIETHSLMIPLESVTLEGDLHIPKWATGIVVFVHGSGSSRKSPRNQLVAQTLNRAGLATLLFDLLTMQEESIDFITAEYRFDIPLLTRRLIEVSDWLMECNETKGLNIGYFGASTGAAAALLAAAERSELIKAVVSRGGRADLAEKGLMHVQAPTLLIVGGQDDLVIQMNESAFEELICVKQLLIIPEATHLFDEPGKLEEVAKAATDWFQNYLMT